MTGFGFEKFETTLKLTSMKVELTFTGTDLELGLITKCLDTIQKVLSNQEPNPEEIYQTKSIKFVDEEKNQETPREDEEEGSEMESEMEDELKSGEHLSPRPSSSNKTQIKKLVMKNKPKKASKTVTATHPDCIAFDEYFKNLSDEEIQEQRKAFREEFGKGVKNFYSQVQPTWACLAALWYYAYDMSLSKDLMDLFKSHIESSVKGMSRNGFFKERYEELWTYE